MRTGKPQPDRLLDENGVSILSWEEVSGKYKDEERYAVYVAGDNAEPVLLLSTDCEEGVGTAICTAGREGQFERRTSGVLDRQGKKGQRWLSLPWCAMDNL